MAYENYEKQLQAYTAEKKKQNEAKRKPKASPVPAKSLSQQADEMKDALLGALEQPSPIAGDTDSAAQEMSIGPITVEQTPYQQKVQSVFGLPSGLDQSPVGGAPSPGAQPTSGVGTGTVPPAGTSPVPGQQPMLAPPKIAGMQAVKAKAGMKVTPGADLPEESSYLGDVMHGIRMLGQTYGEMDKQQQERQAGVDLKVKTAEQESLKRQQDMEADNAARYDAAVKSVDAHVKTLQSFQPKTFMDRSPGRAVLAVIGMGLASASKNTAVLEQIGGIIKEDADKQWQGQIVGLRSDERKLYDEMRAGNSRLEFQKSIEASKWRQVQSEVDTLLKQPLPAEKKARLQELALGIETRLQPLVKDLAHTRLGKVEAYVQAQEAAVGLAKITGGKYDANADPLNSLDPKARARSEQKLKWRAEKLLQNHIPQMREALNRVSDDLNAPDIDQHVGILNTYLSGVTGIGEGQSGMADTVKRGLLELKDPKAVEFYQHLQSIVSQAAFASGGKSLTVNEAAQLIRKSVALGDLAGIRRGIAMIQAETDQTAATIDQALSQDERSSAYYRDALGQVDYLGAPATGSGPLATPHPAPGGQGLPGFHKP